MTVTANTRRPDRPLLGVLLIVATVCVMALADAVVKLVSADFPLWQIYVVRSLIAIPLLLAPSLLARRSAPLRPRAPGWTFLRSLLLVLMYLAIYAAVPVLSLSVIAAALYTGPLFIALLSALLIGEPVGRRRWLAVLLGFGGVLVVLRPGSEAFSWLTLIPVLAALFYALAAIITRAKCAEESPAVLAVALNYTLLATGAVATAAIALWHPGAQEAASYPFLLGYWVAMGPREWGIIALLALLIVAIGLGLAKAYQSGPPTLIATFDYSYLGFAAVWSFAIFGEIPDRTTLAGMLLIALAGLLVVQAPARDSSPSSPARGSGAPRARS